MSGQSSLPRLIKQFAIGIAVGVWATVPHSLSNGGSGFFGHSAAYAQDAEEVSPTMVRDRPREVYFPNTENLAEDEMRVIACGTGMPTTRAAQAAACFLVDHRSLCRSGHGAVLDAAPGCQQFH